MDVAFPYDFDAHGHTAAAGYADHVRQLVEQLLFTAPGERVNRPEFGTGLLQLVFAPNSPELAATVEFTIQAALEQWLGDLIQVDALRVESEEAVLRVGLTYTLRATGEQASVTLTPGGGP
jgi:phage baseplate assembly protein W